MSAATLEALLAAAVAEVPDACATGRGWPLLLRFIQQTVEDDADALFLRFAGRNLSPEQATAEVARVAAEVVITARTTLQGVDGLAAETIAGVEELVLDTFMARLAELGASGTGGRA